MHFDYCSNSYKLASNETQHHVIATDLLLEFILICGRCKQNTSLRNVLSAGTCRTRVYSHTSSKVDGYLASFATSSLHFLSNIDSTLNVKTLLFNTHDVF